jgi:hypothetical protein
MDIQQLQPEHVTAIGKKAKKPVSVRLEQISSLFDSLCLDCSALAINIRIRGIEDLHLSLHPTSSSACENH